MHKNYSLLLNYCSFALILLVWNEINVIAKDILLKVTHKSKTWKKKETEIEERTKKEEC